MCTFWGEQVEETLNFISDGCCFLFEVFELLNLLIEMERGSVVGRGYRMCVYV